MSLPIDPLRALSDALARAGQPVEHLEPDGEIHRYDPPDKGKGSQPRANA